MLYSTVLDGAILVGMARGQHFKSCALCVFFLVARPVAAWVEEAAAEEEYGPTVFRLFLDESDAGTPAGIPMRLMPTQKACAVHTVYSVCLLYTVKCVVHSVQKHLSLGASSWMGLTLQP